MIKRLRTRAFLHSIYLCFPLADQELSWECKKISTASETNQMLRSRSLNISNCKTSVFMKQILLEQVVLLGRGETFLFSLPGKQGILEHREEEREERRRKERSRGGKRGAPPLSVEENVTFLKELPWPENEARWPIKSRDGAAIYFLESRWKVEGRSVLNTGVDYTSTRGCILEWFSVRPCLDKCAALEMIKL